MLSSPQLAKEPHNVNGVERMRQQSARTLELAALLLRASFLLSLKSLGIWRNVGSLCGALKLAPSLTW